MEDTEWVEDLDALDDSEFFPSPSAAVASRVARGLRRGSSRKVVPSAARPGRAVSPPVRNELSKVYETMKRLEAKQEETTKALAALQFRAAGLQSADLFGLSLSNAIANAAGPVANNDWLAAAAQAAPLLQNVQGAAASFKAKPFSTLAFPIGALGLHLARKPAKPQIIVTNPDKSAKNGGFRIIIHSPGGGTIRYTTDGKDVTRDSPEYKEPETVPAATAAAQITIKARAYFLARESEQDVLLAIL